MPARTLNDFFAGFFYGRPGVELEAKMAMTGKRDRRKGNRRQSTGRNTLDNPGYQISKEET
jgi:hypothetical protein